MICIIYSKINKYKYIIKTQTCMNRLTKYKNKEVKQRATLDYKLHPKITVHGHKSHTHDNYVSYMGCIGLNSEGQSVSTMEIARLLKTIRLISLIISCP